MVSPSAPVMNMMNFVSDLVRHVPSAENFRNCSTQQQGLDNVHCLTLAITDTVKLESTSFLNHFHNIKSGTVCINTASTRILPTYYLMKQE
jgi:hypothetical protein